MSNKNNLSDALNQCLEMEINVFEAGVAQVSDYNFSRHYLRKKERIIREAEKRAEKTSRNSEFVPVHSISSTLKLKRVVSLVAALVIVLASAVVVAAAVGSYIKNHVSETDIDWGITFEHEPNDTATEFKYIEPTVPEGYEKVEEHRSDSLLSILYKDDNGDIIDYTQMFPEGSFIGIDNERHDVYTDIIEGTEMIISEAAEGKGGSIIFNNGTYVFHIAGTCDTDLIKQMAVRIIETTN